MEKTVIIVFILLLLTAQPAVAQQQKFFVQPGILPDSGIYWLDLLGEEVRYLFTFGKIKKAEYKIEIAEERLSELRALYEKGVTDKTDALLKKYEKEIIKSQELFSVVKINSEKQAKEVQTETENANLLHEASVNDYVLSLPDQLAMVVRNSIGAIWAGFDSVLDHLDQKRRDIEQKRTDFGV